MKTVQAFNNKPLNYTTLNTQHLKFALDRLIYSYFTCTQEIIPPPIFLYSLVFYYF